MKKWLSILFACALLGAACAPQTEPPVLQATEAVETPVIMEASSAPEQTQPAQTEAHANESAPVDADYTALLMLLTRVSTEYHPGTAGCSLQAVKLAGMLLDWNAKNAGGGAMIALAAQSVLGALPPEAAGQYAAQLADIHSAAQQLTQDGAQDWLASAGYAPEAYPYASADVETLFAALQSGVTGQIPASSYLKQMDPAQPFSMDINGDGALEQVTVAVDEDAYVTDVTIAGEQATYQDHLDTALMFLSAYTCDAWQGDGSQALILCGDEASDDYKTVVYRVQNGALQRAEAYGSLVDADETGVLTLDVPINVFGTYGGCCRYRLDDGFALSLCSPYLVMRSADNGGERKLTVIRDRLPAAALEDGAAVKTALSNGTKLQLMLTDQLSYAVLMDANGAYYRVEIAKPEGEWQWQILGTLESDCFEPLLYAG